WHAVFRSTTHCGAGCTLGDTLGETLFFLLGIVLFGSTLLSDYIADFTLAYLLGVGFQYFAIVPMCGYPPLKGLWEAIKADTLSLAAFEVGMFAGMAAMHWLPLPKLHPNEPVYWFFMQIAMLLGFATSFPMNWWLVKKGIKERM
ncbi:MAG TPA: DUF4396 domain-containing protein, partial [Oscillatoriaceae cyanobacterium]